MERLTVGICVREVGMQKQRGARSHTQTRSPGGVERERGKECLGSHREELYQADASQQGEMPQQG